MAAVGDHRRLGVVVGGAVAQFRTLGAGEGEFLRQAGGAGDLQQLPRALFQLAPEAAEEILQVQAGKGTAEASDTEEEEDDTEELSRKAQEQKEMDEFDVSDIPSSASPLFQESFVWRVGVNKTR